MDNITKITYPGSKKIYMQGSIFPDLQVGMREITLTPTVTKTSDGKKHFQKNAPVTVYDTSGAFGDENIEVDLKKGLPRLRENWIKERGDAMQLDSITSEYGGQIA